MAAFVLDASVAVSWCFPGDPTEDTPYSRRILKELASNDGVVPEIWAFEIANAVFVSHSKRKRITEQQVREYLDLLQAYFGSNRKASGPMSIWNPWPAVRTWLPMTPLT